MCSWTRRALGLGGAALLWAAWPCRDAAAQVPDPTQPPSSRALEELPAAGADALALAPQRLTAIVVSPTRRVAVIDGVPVRVGDQLGDARVIEIEPLSVKLRGPDGDVVLSIAGPPLKGKKRP